MAFNYFNYGSLIGSDSRITGKQGMMHLVAYQLLGDALFDMTAGNYSFSFYAGGTGFSAPSNSSILSKYDTTTFSWLTVPTFFSTSSGIQQFTVPKTGTYRFHVGGASGGYHNYWGGGGNGGVPQMFGAEVTTDINLDIEEKINILIGHVGESAGTYYNITNNSSEGDNAAPGGGGGTFVWRDSLGFSTFPLIGMGGGAGGNRNANSAQFGNASITEAGRPGQSSVSYSGQFPGGTSGTGGHNYSSGSSYWAGAGGGWHGDGGGGRQQGHGNRTAGSSGAQGGQGIQNGGLGGIRWTDNTDSGGNGGFGGGGGGGSDNMGTGGGGGYSGGGGANSNPSNSSGGGGGSYAQGMIESSISVRTTHGDGFVTVTPL